MSRLSKIKEKLFCPLASALLQIILLYVIFFQYFEIKDHYYTSLAGARIKQKIQNAVNYCGYGSFISWIVLDSNNIRNKYFFSDVIGCGDQNLENCAYSVKDLKLNLFYNEERHYLDDDTYNFLVNLESEKAYYYSNEDLGDIYQYGTFQIAIDAALSKIHSLGIAIVKDKKNNIVYLFSLTNTISDNKCNEEKASSILEDIALTAKQNL